MGIETKNNNLINLLISRTKEKKLTWIITSKPNKYVLYLNSSQISVEYSNFKMGIPSVYEFIIVDKFGDTIEKLQYDPSNPISGFNNIRILYDVIKNNMDIKVGQTIDSIITELG